MDKRSVLAMTLSFVIFVGWMLFVQPRLFPPPKPVPVAPKAATPATPPAALTPATPAAPAAPAAPVGEIQSYPEAEPFFIGSKYLELVLTNKGAGIKSAVLRFPKQGDQVPLLPELEPRWPHLAVRVIGGPAIESLPWQIMEQKPDRAEFRYRLPNGVVITKIISVDADRHTFGMTLLLDNKNPNAEGKGEPADVPVTLEILAFNGLDHDSSYKYDQYLMGIHRYDGKQTPKPLAEVEKGESKLTEALRLPEGKERNDDVKSVELGYLKIEGGRKEWFGLKNRFFAALLDPEKSTRDVMDAYWFRLMTEPERKGREDRKNIRVFARSAELRVGAGRRILQFAGYLGPLQEEPLREIPGASDLAGYTGGCILAPVVGIVVPVILGALKLIAGIFHNWGVAIILTTLLIKLCLFPLSLKSQRSALQMQQLAPKIAALKERYKDDQQKYGVEQMRLFKENKVNPLSGCLPLFIQMPIFVGMYSVFEMSIELRNAPFMLWIKDLSEPDRLLGPWSPIHINLILGTLTIDALNLLPILMTITWFLQAYLTPRSPDPQMAQQQKMMMFMPIVFGLTCYGLASGLSLYFLVNSLLGMAEQKIIKTYILKIPPGAPGAPATKTA